MTEQPDLFALDQERADARKDPRQLSMPFHSCSVCGSSNAPFGFGGSPHCRAMMLALHEGDCLEVLKTLADNSIDAVVTDPPYGLEFMGKEWDAPWQTSSKSALFGKRDRPTPGWATTRNPNCQICHGRLRGEKTCTCETPTWDEAPTATNLRQMRAFQEWCEGWAREVLRVLKPGGHCVAFSGTRTYHRMACAIEDAGFEVRDQLAWTYGQGFPKSLNVGNGWGTALKPAWEPICLARKPLSEKTVAANVLRWGTGAINVDGCRVEYASAADLDNAKGGDSGSSGRQMDGWGLSQAIPQSQKIKAAGRFPANLCHDGSQEVLDLFPESKSTGGLRGEHADMRGDNFNRSNGARLEGSNSVRGHTDSGSAARFFYCSKASKHDRITRLIEDVRIEWISELGPCRVTLQVDTERLHEKAIVVSDCDTSSEWSTFLYGKAIVDLFQTATKCITKTRTSSITGLKTWNLLTTLLISEFTGDANYDPENGGSHAENAESSSPSLTITVGPMGFRLGASHVPSGTPLTISVSARRHSHPTTKPIKLMQWLCRMVTPPGGTILDPFAGSGTTGEAAILEGFQPILIEREPEYINDIRCRLTAALYGGNNLDARVK